MKRNVRIVAALAAAAALTVGALVVGGGGEAPDGARVDPDAPARAAADVEVAPLAPDDAASERTPTDGDAASGAAAADGAEGDADEPRIVVSGRVLLLAGDGSIAPLPGRAVTLGPVSPPMDAITDAEGGYRFTLGPVRDSMASVYVRAPPTEGSDLISRGRRVDVPGGVARVDGVDLVLLPAPPLVGRVVDPDGAGLQGATVSRGDASTTSEPDGSFALPPLATHLYESWTRIEEGLGATLEGHALVGVEVPGFADDGAWLPIEIVMAPVGAVIVEVVDADGAPRAGEDVRITLQASEPIRVAAESAYGFDLPRWSGETGEDGAVRLTGVPAGPFLEVDAAERVHDAVGPGGVLVAADRAPGAAPIVARAGAELRVRCVVDDEVTIEGVVREPDGSPSAGAFVKVIDDPADRWGQRLEADDEGRFAVRLRPDRDVASVMVYGESARGSRPSYSPFGGRVRADPLCLAGERVVLDGRAEPYGVVLQLRATGTVEGVVLDADGGRVDFATVTLRAEGEPAGPVQASGEPARVDSRGGTFRFGGVLPGRYVVEARSPDHGSARSAPFDHRSKDVVVRFGEPDLARIRVVVEGLGEGARAALAHGMIDAGAHGGLPVLGRTSRITGGGGFPAGGASLSSGVFTYSAAGAQGTVSIEALDPRAGTTLSMAPGPAILGLRAWDADGRPCAELGTGLVRLEAGDHVLRFEPSVAAALVVEVPRDAPPGELVEVRDADGALVAEARVTSQGTARLDGLPSGPVEVLVGSRGVDGLVPRARAAATLPGGGELRLQL